MKQKRPFRRPLQLHVLLRLACGAYRIYLAWGLREGAFQGQNGMVFGIAMILFGLVGVALAGWNIFLLATGRYRLPHESEYLEDAPASESEMDDSTQSSPLDPKT